MRKTLDFIQDCVSRHRPWIVIGLIFIGGAGFTLSGCVWYFKDVLESQARSYNRQINRLHKDIDLEKEVNREILFNLVQRSDKITNDIGRLATALDELSERVGITANTANRDRKSKRLKSRH